MFVLDVCFPAKKRYAKHVERTHLHMLSRLNRHDENTYTHATAPGNTHTHSTYYTDSVYIRKGKVEFVREIQKAKKKNSGVEDRTLHRENEDRLLEWKRRNKKIPCQSVLHMIRVDASLRTNDCMVYCTPHLHTWDIVL